jgi:hypothetical protein
MTATPCPAHSIIVTVPSGGPCANGGGPAASAGIAIVATIIAAMTSVTNINMILRLMSATSSIAEGGTRQPRPVT